MEFTWITGSVAWYNNILLQHMLGARAEFGGLRIDPRIPAEWKGCTVERQWRGSTYSITIRNPGRKSGGKVEVSLDGRRIDGNLLPAFSDGRIHKVEAVIV